MEGAASDLGLVWSKADSDRGVKNKIKTKTNNKTKIKSSGRMRPLYTTKG